MTHQSSGGSTEELSREYFSSLPLSLVKNLYNIFKVDFLMFGYSPELYYQYAREGESKRRNNN